MADFLKKIQELPVGRKKIIFWILAGLAGVISLTFWVYMIRTRLANIDKNRLNQDLRLLEIKDQFNQLKNLPSLKIDTSQLEEQLKNLNEEEE